MRISQESQNKLNQVDKLIFALSGGRDSTATLVWGLNHLPKEKIVCIFADTKVEFPEVYIYLNKIEQIFNIKIEKVSAKLGYEEYLEKHHWFIPSIIHRWCTKELKINPINKWKKQFDKLNTVTCIGGRIDEKRKNNPTAWTYKSDGIQYRPFLELNYTIKDVKQILNDSGIGESSIYKFKSRTGCWCCFFQKKSEWLNLNKYYPELYERAIYHEEENAKYLIKKKWFGYLSSGLSLRSLREMDKAQLKLFPDEELECGKFCGACNELRLCE